MGISEDQEREGRPRTIFVGDVHGCCAEMEAVLAKCGFEAGRDRLLLTGDAFTRGLDPLGVWRLLEQTGAEMVLGNHDAWLSTHLKDYVSGRVGKADWPGARVRSQLSRVAEEVLTWLEGLPLRIADRKFDLVHAGVHPQKGIEGTRREEFLAIRTWPPTGNIHGQRWHDAYPPGEKVLIFGHDAPRGLVVKRHRDGQPYLIGLDTGCVYGGQLTAYVLEADCVHQVESRTRPAPEVRDGRDRLEVTAIVVNWNSGEMLQACVQALLTDREKLDLRVVVVDNGSDDGSVGMLGSLREDVDVIRTGENVGFGRAVNRGLELSEAPFVAVLNPDVILNPDALTKMVRFLASEGRAGIVGPRLYDRCGRIRRSCGSSLNLLGEVCRKLLLHIVFPLFKVTRRSPDTLDETGWVTGACFVSRRAAIQDVNGMDDRFFMYYEDVDLCLRMRRAGWRVFYEPQAEGLHAGGWSSKHAYEEMLMASEASHDYFVEKHMGSAAAALLRGLRPFEMALRWSLWSLVYLLSPKRRDEAGPRLRAYRRMLAQGGRRLAGDRGNDTHF